MEFKQKEGMIHAVIFCLLPGAYFLLVVQTWSLLQGRGGILFTTVVTYEISFFIVSLVGIFLAFLSTLPLKKETALKGPSLLTGGYAFILIISWVYGALYINDFSTSMIENLALMGILFLICIAGFVWRPKDTVLRFKAFILLALIAGLIIPWGIKMPEWSFLSSPYKFWANALSLALMIGLAFRGRLLMPVSMRVDAALVLLLLSASLVMNLVATADGPKVRGSDLEENPVKADITGKGERPNIIFIVWDTVRRDHLGVYGYHRNNTPYLNKRIAGSVIYKNAFSVSGNTLPSHSSMFTGLYPYSHGAHGTMRNNKPGSPHSYRTTLSETFSTLAENLAKQGYTCGGISSNYVYAGKSVNMDQGFDFFDDSKNVFFPAIDVQIHLLFLDLLNRFTRVYLYFPAFSPTTNAKDVTDRALKWIDSTTDRPFFLFMNYMDAHSPYFPPPELACHFTNRQEARIRKDGPMNDAEVAWLNSQYDACILYLDRQLGRFEQELEKRGLFEDAFIVLVSDHGECLGEYGLIGHGYDVFPELVNIPLILKYPKEKQTGTVSSPFENRSLFYLVMKMAGVNLNVPKSEWGAICEEYTALGADYRQGDGNSSASTMSRAVFFDEYKLYSYNTGEVKLYEYLKDPYEKNDLAKNLPDKVEKGKSLINKFLDTMPPYKQERGDEKLNKKEINDLKALGYIE